MQIKNKFKYVVEFENTYYYLDNMNHRLFDLIDDIRVIPIIDNDDETENLFLTKIKGNLFYQKNNNYVIKNNSFLSNISKSYIAAYDNAYENLNNKILKLLFNNDKEITTFAQLDSYFLNRKNKNELGSGITNLKQLLKKDLITLIENDFDLNFNNKKIISKNGILKIKEYLALIYVETLNVINKTNKMIDKLTEIDDTKVELMEYFIDNTANYISRKKSNLIVNYKLNWDFKKIENKIKNKLIKFYNIQNEIAELIAIRENIGLVENYKNIIEKMFDNIYFLMKIEKIDYEKGEIEKIYNLDNCFLQELQFSFDEFNEYRNSIEITGYNKKINQNKIIRIEVLREKELFLKFCEFMDMINKFETESKINIVENMFNRMRSE
jgi:hypothetical protein